MKHDLLILKTLWALGNIAGDSKENRIILFQWNVFELLVETLLKYMEKPNEFRGVLQHGVWFLSNICRDKPISDNMKTYKAIPLFCQFAEIFYDDTYILTDISWALLQLALIYISLNQFCRF